MAPIVIGIGALGAMLAGLACWAAHEYAERHRWRFIHRCIYGVSVICACFAAPLFAALAPEMAGTLFLLLILVCVGAGLGTWLNYQDKPAPLSETPDADEYLRKLNDEIG